MDVVPPDTLQAGQCVAVYESDGLPSMLGMFFHRHPDLKRSCCLDFKTGHLSRVEETDREFLPVPRAYAATMVVGMQHPEGSDMDRLVDLILAGVHRLIESGDAGDEISVPQADWPEGLVQRFYDTYRTVSDRISALVMLAAMTKSGFDGLAH